MVKTGTGIKEHHYNLLGFFLLLFFVHIAPLDILLSVLSHF